MNKFILQILLVWALVAQHRGAGYLYCDELDKQVVKMLKNPLDMVLHLLRKILCVNRKTYDIDALVVEKEKERMDYLNSTLLAEPVTSNDNGELYLYFEHNGAVREFFFPEGTFDHRERLVDFKVSSSDKRTERIVQLQELRG